MSGLQLLWFILIGVLFVGFFFLEGFDYGVGMATKLFAKDKHERDVVIQSIGPVWDGNEVWLITAGGAMFASFPEWYASLFSGYYIMLFLILFALILRGVSFEFRAQMETERGKKFWEWTLFFGSTVTPFLFGMMFTSLVRGLPIAEDRNVYAGFSDYVNLFSVVGGVAVALICYIHALNYLSLKTAGEIRTRAAKVASRLYPVLLVGLVVFAGLLWKETDFFAKRPISTIIILAVIVLAAVVGYMGTLKGKELLAFISTGVILGGIVVLLFNGLFPRVMISSESAARDILITDASSSPYTLKVMTIVSFLLLPFVLAYQAWSYYIFSKRLKVEKIEG